LCATHYEEDDEEMGGTRVCGEGETVERMEGSEEDANEDEVREEEKERLWWSGPT
jgi:hypothetical protein